MTAANDQELDWRRPKTSLPEQLASDLQDRIRRGKLPVNSKVAEKDLGSEYGVSRGTVRSALQILQTLGLVLAEQGSGWRVKPTKTDFHLDPVVSGGAVQLLEVRMSIEPTAASMAALRADAADIKKMFYLNNSYRDTDPNDIEEIVRADEEFHLKLVRSAYNDTLFMLYEQVVPLIREFRRKSYDKDHTLDESIHDHHTIVRAIEKRDPALARVLMLRHLWMLYETLDPDHSSASLPMFG